MRNNIIQEMLDKIPIEERERIRKENDEYCLKQKQLFDEGYRYNTDKSYSLVLLREKGFNPIGICTMMAEETFIFKTKKEADLAWKRHILGYDGWWYSKKDFEVARKEYENDFGEIKIYWL